MVYSKSIGASPASTYPVSRVSQNRKRPSDVLPRHQTNLLDLHSPNTLPDSASNALGYINDYHDLFTKNDFPRILLHPISKAEYEIRRLQLIQEFLTSAQDLFDTITEIEPDIFKDSPRLSFCKNQISDLTKGGNIFNKINLLIKDIPKHGIEGIRPALDEIYLQILQLHNSITPPKEERIEKFSNHRQSKRNDIRNDIPDATGNVIYANERIKEGFAKWMNDLSSDLYYKMLVKKLSFIDKGKVSNEKHGLKRYSAIGRGSKFVGQRSHGVVMEIKIDGSKARIYGIEHPTNHKFVIVGWSDEYKEQERQIVKALTAADSFRESIKQSNI